MKRTKKKKRRIETAADIPSAVLPYGEDSGEDSGEDYEAAYERYLEQRCESERAEKVLRAVRYMGAIEEGFVIFDEIPAASEVFSEIAEQLDDVRPAASLKMLRRIARGSLQWLSVRKPVH